MGMYVQQAVNLYMKNLKIYKDAAEAKGIRHGVYIGNGQVSLGGQIFDIEMASDVHLGRNQMVYVALNQAGNKAVILG